MTKSVFLKPFLALIIIIVFLAGVVCFSNDIIVFYVNQFTDFHITKGNLKGNLFSVVQVSDLEISIKDKGLSFYAKEGAFKLKLSSLLVDPEAVLSSSFSGVKFSGKGNKVFQKEESLLGFISVTNEVYENVKFQLFLDRKSLKLSRFSATSENIDIKGDYTSYLDKDYILVDFTISISPVLANSVPDQLRKGMLSMDDNGWYTTNISYKGNPAFLRAVYAISS